MEAVTSEDERETAEIGERDEEEEEEMGAQRIPSLTWDDSPSPDPAACLKELDAVVKENQRSFRRLVKNVSLEDLKKACEAKNVSFSVMADLYHARREELREAISDDLARDPDLRKSNDRWKHNTREEIEEALTLDKEKLALHGERVEEDVALLKKVGSDALFRLDERRMEAEQAHELSSTMENAATLEKLVGPRPTLSELEKWYRCPGPLNSFGFNQLQGAVITHLERREVTEDDFERWVLAKEFIQGVPGFKSLVLKKRKRRLME